MTKEELEKASLICQQYLQNSDIVDIQHKDDSILLKFTSGDEQSWIEIHIGCFQIQLFSMGKAWDEPMSEGFFVGEAHISYFDKLEEIKKVFIASVDFSNDAYFPKQCYVLKIDGGITIEIVCAELSLEFIRKVE